MVAGQNDKYCFPTSCAVSPSGLLWNFLALALLQRIQEEIGYEATAIYGSNVFLYVTRAPGTKRQVCIVVPKTIERGAVIKGYTWRRLRYHLICESTNSKVHKACVLSGIQDKGYSPVTLNTFSLSDSTCFSDQLSAVYFPCLTETIKN